MRADCGLDMTQPGSLQIQPAGPTEGESSPGGPWTKFHKHPPRRSAIRVPAARALAAPGQARLPRACHSHGCRPAPCTLLFVRDSVADRPASCSSPAGRRIARIASKHKGLARLPLRPWLLTRVLHRPARARAFSDRSAWKSAMPRGPCASLRPSPGGLVRRCWRLGGAAVCCAPAHLCAEAARWVSAAAAA